MLLPLLFLILPVACRQVNNDDIMCTTEYRMLTVSIKDSASGPVVLSSYFVRKTSTGEVIDFSLQEPYADSINRLQGIYFICTDGMMGMTSKGGTGFELHGILGTREVVNEPYVIGKDECHIRMLSGKTEIVVSGIH